MFFQLLYGLSRKKGSVLFIIKFSVILGGKPCICTDNEFRMFKIFHDLFFQRDQGFLFACIPRVDGEGQRDPVTIHEQPHFHDRVRAVFLGRTILLQTFLLLNLEEEVGAIIEEDPVIPFRDGFAVLI